MPKNKRVYENQNMDDLNEDKYTYIPSQYRHSALKVSCDASLEFLVLRNIERCNLMFLLDRVTTLGNVLAFAFQLHV